MFSRQKLTAADVFIFSENRSNCGKCCLATVAASFAWHFKHTAHSGLMLRSTAAVFFSFFFDGPQTC